MRRLFGFVSYAVVVLRKLVFNQELILFMHVALNQLARSGGAEIYERFLSIVCRRAAAAQSRAVVRLLCGCLIAYLPASVSRSAPTATDRTTAAWIQQQINQAIASGASSVKIPAGDYRVAAPVVGHEVLNVLNAHDLTIDATGVRLMVTEPVWGIYVRWSNDVTVKGLSIDYDPLPFTQGKIVDKAIDGSWYNVQIDDGYDVVTGDTRAIFYDPTTRDIKLNSESSYGTITSTGGRIVRVNGNPLRGDVRVNDLVSLTRNDSLLHAVEVEKTTNSKFQDITVESSPNYGIFETAGAGNEYRDVQVVPGPTPSGATQPRLLSSKADAFHSINASIGPKIIDSHFANQGDDGIAIHGMYSLVGASTGNSVIVSAANDLGLSFQVGDKLRGYNRVTGAITQATVTGIQPDTSLDFATIRDTYLPDHLAGPFTLGFKVTLSQPITVGPGDLVASPDRNGSGFQVLGTTIENNRSRGIVVKGSNGLISGNTIDGSTNAGIVVAAEPYPWQEADFSSNVVISNNLVKNTGGGLPNPFNTQAGAISVTGPVDWISQGHSNITLTNNTVENVYGTNLVVNLANGVNVNSNRFIDPLSRPTTTGSLVHVDANSVISIDNVSNVAFAGNIVTTSAAYGQNLLHSTINSSGLSGSETGIRVAHDDGYRIIADYREDFRPGSPASSWHYLWNKNGPIDNPANYLAMVANGSAYSPVVGPIPSPNPADFAMLQTNGGHPGEGVLQGASDDKFVIAAYDVGAAGKYAIQNSFLRPLDLNTGGVEIYVRVNHNDPVFDEIVRSGSTASFDVLLGHLTTGDKIYIAVGSGGEEIFDSFDFDFGVGVLSDGDYNGDGVVDAADYSVWRDSLGSTTHLSADGNANGSVDQGDYDVWKSHFTDAGKINLFGVAAATPEPSTISLALVSLAALCVFRVFVRQRGAS